MSPASPHVWMTNPALDLMMYQLLLEGRYTAMSPFPSPSKSPRTGLSPATPNWNTLKVPFAYRVYQVLLEGRKITRSVLPSASRSVGTGRSPSCPQLYTWNAWVADMWMYHFPSDGRNTATSVFPSPS